MRNISKNIKNNLDIDFIIIRKLEINFKNKMKLKMASIISLKNSQKMIIKKNKTLTDHELMIYQQQKRIKDYEFYSSVIPYISAFFVGLTLSVFLFLHINQKYSRKGIDLFEKLKLNLLDVKEEKK